MRSSEFAPFFRSTVGFDRLFDMLDTSMRSEWPPYNIEKKSEDEYRIVMAIAGFGPAEVELTQHGAELTVVGQKRQDDENRQFLYRGLAGGNFRQVFRLADYVKVVAATVENGLLFVDLARQIPEEMKPRRISISSAEPQSAEGSDPAQIGQDTEPRRRAA